MSNEPMNRSESGGMTWWLWAFVFALALLLIGWIVRVPW